MASEPNTTERSADAPDIGVVLARKYRLNRVLGEGSYAWVYAATHETVETLRFAVKILKPAHANNADVLRRFKQEANTIAQLQSRHTVRVFDFGVAENGSPFIVMEHIRGLSLRQLLHKEERLHPLTAARLAAGVLKALVEAHGHGIVHRDLKPSNILVTRPQDEKIPIAKVLDFGIAKVVSADGNAGMNAEETVEGLLFCSPRYASPEILNARPALQSDLYSLGIIMAEMLEGEAPYNGDNSILVAARHLSDDAVPLGPRVVESGYYNVVQRACAKKLDERYPSAAAMLEDLEASIRRLEALSGIRTEAQVAAIHPSVTGPFTLDGRSVHASLPKEVTASATQPVAARDLRRSIDEQLRRATPASDDAADDAPAVDAADDAQLSALLEEGTLDEEDAAIAVRSPGVQSRPTAPVRPGAADTPAPPDIASRITPKAHAPLDLDAIVASPSPSPSVFETGAEPVVDAPPASRRGLIVGGVGVAALLAIAFVVFRPGPAEAPPADVPVQAEAAPAPAVPATAEAAASPSVASAAPAAVPAAPTPAPSLRPALREARDVIASALSPAARRLTITAPVPGAWAELDGRRFALPVNEVWAPLAAGQTLTIGADGHQPSSFALQAVTSRTISAQLAPVAAERARPAARGNEPARPAAAPADTPSPAPAATAPPAREDAPAPSGDSLRHTDIRNPWQ